MSSVPTLPKLGKFQQDIILNDGFTCDLATFRKYKSGYQEMRILHVSKSSIPIPGRSLKILETKDQLSEIQQFMERLGYSQEDNKFHRTTIHPQFCPDVVIIGCFTQDIDYVKSLVQDLERNHGIFGVWDIMVYFIDEVPTSEVENVLKKVSGFLGGSGIISRYDFVREAECMIHAHLRRRYDVISRRGAYVTLFDRILTKSLDSFSSENNDVTLGVKIGRVERILKKHSSNGDIPVILKILKLLLSARNWAIHLGDKAFKKREAAWNEVRDDIMERGYPHLRVHPPNRPKSKMIDTQGRHEVLKTDTILTYRIKDWLEEYAKTQQMG